MAKRDALSKRFEVFLSAATIASHAVHPRGFRQRDVKFLFELFTNWAEHLSRGQTPQIKNTQVQRYIGELTAEGFATQSSAKAPQYKLSRMGLLELLTRLVGRSNEGSFECFLFVYYFIQSYREVIIELIRSSGSHFPPGLQMEIEALLDLRELLRVEIRTTERELQKLANRIDTARRANQLACRMFQRGEPLDAVVEEVEKKHPYDLNNQKPLSEVIGSMSPQLGQRELEFGHLKRIDFIWEPSRQLMQSYLRCLQSLEKAL